ncbi:hypothetical protein B0H14DRAFT_2633773 [Mycena olivaceomarginata]|nr:hypothetical protein B0H14DRAFT_2633773 [Mycena olivaceomarginata]
MSSFQLKSAHTVDDTGRVSTSPPAQARRIATTAKPAPKRLCSDSSDDESGDLPAPAELTKRAWHPHSSKHLSQLPSSLFNSHAVLKFSGVLDMHPPAPKHGAPARRAKTTVKPAPKRLHSSSSDNKSGDLFAPAEPAKRHRSKCLSRLPSSFCLILIQFYQAHRGADFLVTLPENWNVRASSTVKKWVRSTIGKLQNTTVQGRHVQQLSKEVFQQEMTFLIIVSSGIKAIHRADRDITAPAMTIWGIRDVKILQGHKRRSAQC